MNVSDIITFQSIPLFLPSGQQASCCSGLLGSGSGSTNDTTLCKRSTGSRNQIIKKITKSNQIYFNNGIKEFGIGKANYELVN